MTFQWQFYHPTCKRAAFAAEETSVTMKFHIFENADVAQEHTSFALILEQLNSEYLHDKKDIL